MSFTLSELFLPEPFEVQTNAMGCALNRMNELQWHYETLFRSGSTHDARARSLKSVSRE